MIAFSRVWPAVTATVNRSKVFTTPALVATQEEVRHLLVVEPLVDLAVDGASACRRRLPSQCVNAVLAIDHPVDVADAVDDGVPELSHVELGRDGVGPRLAELALGFTGARDPQDSSGTGRILDSRFAVAVRIGHLVFQPPDEPSRVFAERLRVRGSIPEAVRGRGLGSRSGPVGP